MEELFISNNNSRLLASPSSPSGQVELTPSPAELNLSPAELTPSPAELGKAVVLGLFCAMGIPGNVAVLTLLLRKLERNNFTQMLMLNLACCDLLYLTTLPVWIVHAVRHRDINHTLCKFISFLVFCSLYVNIFTITLMSVQRFVKVLHHHRWARLGRRGERALLVGLWGGSCFITWPSVASTGRTTRDGHFDCSRPSRLEGQTLAATLMELTLGFIVPFCVMTSFYCCLYHKVKETALSSNKRTSQLISRIIVTFLLLWVPIHVVGIVGLVGTSLRTSRPDMAATLDRFTDKAKIVKNLPLFSAIIDPFLYVYSFSKLWPKNRDNPNPNRDNPNPNRDNPNPNRDNPNPNPNRDNPNPNPNPNRDSPNPNRDNPNPNPNRDNPNPNPNRDSPNPNRDNPNPNPNRDNPNPNPNPNRDSPNPNRDNPNPNPNRDNRNPNPLPPDVV